VEARHRQAFQATARWRPVLWVLGAVCLAPAFIFPNNETPWIPSLGLSLFMLGAAAWVVAAATRPPSASTAIRGLAMVGAQSYSVYLWHLPVRNWLVWNLGLSMEANWLTAAPVYLAGSVLVGIGMARLCERPSLALRDRWFPSRAAPTAEPHPHQVQSAGTEPMRPPILDPP